MFYRRTMGGSGLRPTVVEDWRGHHRLDFDENDLGPGDSFCFDSSRPHLFYNPGTVPARGVWFVFDTATHTADIRSLLDAMRTANGSGESRTHLPTFR